MSLFILAPGGFFVFGILTAIVNKITGGKLNREFSCSGCPGDPETIAELEAKKVPETVGCGEGCASCGNASSCSGKIFPTGEEDAKNE